MTVKKANINGCEGFFCLTSSMNLTLKETWVKLETDKQEFCNLEEKNSFLMIATRKVLYSLEIARKGEAFVIPNAEWELTAKFLGLLNSNSICSLYIFS